MRRADERRSASVMIEHLDEDFVVSETPDAGLGQWQIQPFGDGLRQSWIGVAGDQLDRAVLGGHRRFSPRLAGYDVQHLGYL
jgi:hypothetical protein